MPGETKAADGIVARRRNAVVTWVLLACIAVAAVVSTSRSDFLWAGLGLTSVAIAMVPVAAYRHWSATLPWEVSLFVALPYGLQSFDLLLSRSVAAFLVVPALALAIAVEVDAFTVVEMSPEFAVVFVVTGTMATAGAWAVVQWAVDLTLGTRYIRGLQGLMWSLAAATATGVVAGVVFAGYLRRVDRERLGFWTANTHERVTAESAEATEAVESSPRRFDLSDHRQRQVVRGLQFVLVVVLLVGIYELNVGVVVNTLVALAVMELPGLLERDYGLPIDAGLTLWIVIPVFLHALGSFGLYNMLGLWDNLTHALSSSLVAATGYATFRAFDVHDEAVVLPRKFVAGFILVFTLAFGVLWELLEFGLDGLATMTGTVSVLAQVSLANTMSDLVFDLVGGVLVAVWGAAYLSGVSRSLAERLAAEGESE